MSAHLRTAPSILHLASGRAPEPVRAILARAGLAELPIHATDLGVETIRGYGWSETRLAFAAPPRDVNRFLLEAPSPAVRAAPGASTLDGPAPESFDVPWWGSESVGAGCVMRWATEGGDVAEVVVDEARTRVWIRVTR
jgi:hypothetical protein